MELDGNNSEDGDDEKTVTDNNTVCGCDKSNDGITPLMVACDKGNEACLIYMLNKFLCIEKSKEPTRLRKQKKHKLRHLLGNPLVDVSTKDHNTALHHAAMAGCSSAIITLNRIQSLLDDEHSNSDSQSINDSHDDIDTIASPSTSPLSKTHYSVTTATTATTTTKLPSKSFILSLGSARNIHNDTPLMMAAAQSSTTKGVDFVKTWYTLALKEQQQDSVVVKQVLETRNDSLDTCLSLACSHGRVDLVKYLIGYEEEGNTKTKTTNQDERCALLDVTNDELNRCQQSFERMEQALNQSRELKEQYQSQRDDVKRCLDMMESRLSVRADAVARELLQELENENDDDKDGRSSPQNRQKPKQKQKKQPQPTTAVQSTSSNVVIPDNQKKDDSDVILTTLPDGTRAVRVTGEDHIPTASQPLPIVTTSTLQTNEMDAGELLRERFKGTGISQEVDSVMSALCLDVKCLLYSDHGMALNLSPAQLDAVQQILQKQLESVQKARDIQQRMHETKR
jgi:ankyrin repeat protein